MAECRGFKNKLGTTIVSLIAKVTGAIAGNIATFNSDGELVDSGKALNSLVEKSGTTFSGNIASFGSNGVIVDSARPVSSLFAKIGESFTVGNIAVFDKQPFTNIVGIKDSGKSVDTSVTSGSSNLITSGGVYRSITSLEASLLALTDRVATLESTVSDAKCTVSADLVWRGDSWTIRVDRDDVIEEIGSDYTTFNGVGDMYKSVSTGDRLVVKAAGKIIADSTVTTGGHGGAPGRKLFTIPVAIQLVGPIDHQTVKNAITFMLYSATT